MYIFFFFFSSRRRHTRLVSDWSSDVCSSDLLVTIGVALSAFGTLGDRFDDVEQASTGERIALDLKFAVTDMNGWQTAYGYDSGRSQPRFEASARNTQELFDRARRELTAPPERALLAELGDALDAFMAL